MIIFIVPKNSGLDICSSYTDRYVSESTQILKVRGEDVALFVEKLTSLGKNVIGITGEDLFFEYTFDKNSFLISEKIVWNDENFIFKKPALCLLGPKTPPPEALNNITVAVNKKYKNLSNKFLKEYFCNINYQIIYVTGSSEELFSSGAVNYVVDIVCSGKSAKEAGLSVYAKIFESDIVSFTYSEKKFDLPALYDTIIDRIKNGSDKSYTKKLISNPNELKRKIIEEAGEVITFDSRENLVWECSDLIYFLFVLMAKEGITLKDIEKENLRRDKETLLNQEKLNNLKGET